MNKENEKKRTSFSCVDYRKYMYCKLIWIDDGLAARGLTRPLLFIMVWMMGMVSFGLISFVMSTQNKARLDNLRSFLLESMVTMSIFNEYMSRKSLAQLHQFMDESMRTSRTELREEEEILETAKSQARKHLAAYIVIFSFNLAAMILSQPLAEWLQGNSWKKLPYPWVVPPSNTEFMFWIVFLYQSIGLYFSHCLGMVIMSFSSITIQVTALFDVLLLSLRHIEARAKVRMEREGTDYITSITDCLKDDVVHHQRLVSELVSATPHLRRTFFALSVTISMIMACEAYPLIMGNFTLGELIKGLLFLVVQFMCWGQMCTRMEIMADQNSEVFHALYNTPWYSSGLKYKKLMVTPLTFSRHSMYIKSPLFTEMSATMSTFYSFVVSSFNILNLIRKMK
uniref:Odorant receptor n=1 Tax=Adelphocoris lineolatus TaxID=236346 RepID=A0A2I4PH16_ADELI|nr:olfactory receptor 20 [Adelphocoris lineolatus]